MEIGSEFWLTDDKNPGISLYERITGYKFLCFTASGRGALSLLLENIVPRQKTVLIPSYICDSVVDAFLRLGYQCFFYPISKDMRIEMERIPSEVLKQTGVFFYMEYFGFQSNVEIRDFLKRLKNNKTIIIEDVTHSLFSDFTTEERRYEEIDYYIGSLRKWVGIPSGAFVSSDFHKIPQKHLSAPSYISLRKQALYLKKKYIIEERKELKAKYMGLFHAAETILQADFSPYRIDEISLQILKSTSFLTLKERRRDNYNLLMRHIKKQERILPVYSSAKEEICPMFYPVYIRQGRDRIQRKLARHSIYCPIHWKKPQLSQITDEGRIYDTILSIPCDQRYEEKDMLRIIAVIETMS